MRGHVNNLLVWGVFSSVIFQNTALDCETIKSKRFPSPILNAETTVVTMGQNVSLFCSHKNKSLEITYYLFLNAKLLGDQTGKMEHAVFNISISKNKDLGPYKCKAGSFNCTKQGKYSQELNFTIVDGDSCPLCLQLLLPGLLLLLLLAVALILGFWIRRRRKARKTMRKNELKSHENIPEEAENYASIEICKTQAETGPSLELFYATPVFHNQASEQQGGQGKQMVPQSSPTGKSTPCGEGINAFSTRVGLCLQKHSSRGDGRTGPGDTEKTTAVHCELPEELIEADTDSTIRVNYQDPSPFKC